MATTVTQDNQYGMVMGMVKNSFQRHSSEPLFITDVPDLFQVYLQGIPVQYRQHYNCHECRRFLNRVGSLVVVDDHGKLVPAMWDFHIEGFFEDMVKKLGSVIRRSKIVDTFQGEGQRLFGVPVTGEWTHLSAESNTILKGDSRKEDFKNVKRAISEFTPQVLDRALVLLRADALFRGEKIMEQAEWFRSLYDMKNDNLVWRAVSKAPAGFCHPRSSMMGTLLDDLLTDLPVADAVKKFSAKMHPLKYMRPTAAPTDQAIKQAEEIVQKLEVAGSLQRRFLRPDEVVSIWTPRLESKKPEGGVFGGLKTKSRDLPTASGSPISITWEKFRRTVLQTAEKIFYRSTRGVHPFAALVTAVNPESPPILQWDSEEQRNPVSWYLHNGGRYPSQFNLTGDIIPVTHVALQPNQWFDEGKYAHQGEGVFFVIEGCKEMSNGSLALFPETMRSEFHGVRKVIEAYSKANKIQETPGPNAAGILMQKGVQTAWNEIFEVEASGQRVLYKLDRWD